MKGGTVRGHGQREPQRHLDLPEARPVYRFMEDSNWIFLSRLWSRCLWQGIGSGEQSDNKTINAHVLEIRGGQPTSLLMIYDPAVDTFKNIRGACAGAQLDTLIFLEKLA